ncbi:MAG: preprotein translocase subunit SecG [Bacteroidota bacterium]|jgi:preprotein translocase subunit SecG
MIALLSVLIIIASALLVLVVFVQNPKGGGLSTDFGAAHQIGGVQKTNDFIDKATWILAGSIMVLSIVITIMSKPVQEAQPQEEQTQQQGQGGGQPQQPGKQNAQPAK